VPTTWITDRGSQFVNKFTKTLCARLGIDHFPTTAYHPQGDGQTERVNAPLEAYLRHYINYTQDDWAEWLDMAEFAYNNSEHAATKMTPFYALHGDHPNFTIRNESPGVELSDAVATAHANKIQDVRAFLRGRAQEAREAMRKYYDQHHQDMEFEEGDLVWLKTDNIRTRRKAKKLDHKKIGPFIITAKIGTRAYKLELPESLAIHDVFHVGLLELARESSIEGQPQYDQGLVEADEDAEEWDVEGIVDSKIEAGAFLYKVRWSGAYEDTWQPPCDLDCYQLVNAFHISNPDKPKPEARELRRMIRRTIVDT
jgi:hypothetical protein